MNNQSQPNFSNLHALKQQLDMAMLVQAQNFAGLAHLGLDANGMMMNQACFGQMSSLNHLTTSLLNFNQLVGTNQPMLNYFPGNAPWAPNLPQNYQISKNQEMEQNSGEVAEVDKIGETLKGDDTTCQEASILAQNSISCDQKDDSFKFPGSPKRAISGIKRQAEQIENPDCSKAPETRTPSLSVDQITQETEPKEGDVKAEPKTFGKVETLVFNIRRYNRKEKKFVVLTRHRKIITKCKHRTAEYYAKGMCKKCYHNKGERSKFATVCGHTDQFHYAKGLCKVCYLTDYHKDRKSKTQK